MTGFANATCSAAFCFSVGNAGTPVHAAVQREGCVKNGCVKIASNEIGLKKFLLNLFWF